MRLISMLTMLVVLGMIIARASDPATWKWLAGDAGAGADQERAQGQVAPRGKSPPAKPVTKQPAPEHVTEGPTDEDIEEQDGAFEEFMALTDRALGLGKEEMPAYWRLFKWTEHQSTAQMQKRAKAQLQEQKAKQVVFNQFMRDPEAQRGKLFTLKLNVRRVLSYDAPDNSAGVKQVHEIWGVTDESKAWLYCVVTAHLPEGMPVGANVNETATVTGYFLKLQGYYEGGAGPRDKPLAAPLLVGRVSWKPSDYQAAKDQPADWSWLRWAVGLIVAFGILRTGLWLYDRWNPAYLPNVTTGDSEGTAKSAGVRRWLADAGSDADSLNNRSLDPTDQSAGWNGSSQQRNLPDFHNN